MRKEGAQGREKKAKLSQQSPRAHHSLPQSFNRFSSLACSSPPLENSREALRRREGLFSNLFLRSKAREKKPELKDVKELLKKTLRNLNGCDPIGRSDFFIQCETFGI